jgi:hypothetical protein
MNGCAQKQNEWMGVHINKMNEWVRTETKWMNGCAHQQDEWMGAHRNKMNELVCTATK